jgi:protein TonB
MPCLLYTALVSAMLVANLPLDAQVTGGQQTPSATPQPPAETPQGPVEAPWPPEGVYRPGKGVTMPRIIKEIGPGYTPGAMRAMIEGSILLEAVVLPDGTVGKVRVKRPLDQQYGLDETAVAAVKKWQFVAGTKDDVAVPVVVEVEMTFAIGKRKK